MINPVYKFTPFTGMIAQNLDVNETVKTKRNGMQGQSFYFLTNLTGHVFQPSK